MMFSEISTTQTKRACFVPGKLHLILDSQEIINSLNNEVIGLRFSNMTWCYIRLRNGMQNRPPAMDSGQISNLLRTRPRLEAYIM